MKEFEDPPRLVESPDAPFALRSLLERAYADAPDSSEIERLVKAVERRTSPFPGPRMMAARPMLIKLVVGIVGIGGGLWLWAGRHSAPGAVTRLESPGAAMQLGAPGAEHSEPRIGSPFAASDGTPRMATATEAPPTAPLRGDQRMGQTVRAGEEQTGEAERDLERFHATSPAANCGTASDCEPRAEMPAVAPGAHPAAPGNNPSAAGGDPTKPEAEHAVSASGHPRTSQHTERAKHGRPSRGAQAASPASPASPAPHTAALPEPANPAPPSPTAGQEQAAPDGDEYKLLRSARGALPGDPSRALALTEEHKRRFSTGMLSQERDAIAIEALARVGRRAEASTRLARFVRQYPNSPYRGRLEGMLHDAREANPTP